jgi:hypothetical protein
MIVDRSKGIAMHNRQPYVFQTSLERKIYSLINNEAEMNDVYITAQVEEGVARYRAEAAGMSLLEVRGEGIAQAISSAIPWIARKLLT